MSDLVIATLFPLSTVAAGDEANAGALVRRARQRGVSAAHVRVDRPEEMAEADLYLVGGEGLAGVADLVAHLEVAELTRRVRQAGPWVFAVDAGLAAIARSWGGDPGEARPGLGLLPADVRVAHRAARSVVTLAAPGIGLPAMVGWQADAVTVTRDPGVDPLVQVADVGRASAGQPDGALTDRVVATTLHGPVLALNPELADLVLARVLGVPGWDPLPVPSAERARARRIAELTAGSRGRRGKLRGRH